jgi:SsrA-binding protein
MAVKTEAELGARTVASNRKARHDYFIEETFEAGIALTGTEIKSVRKGQVNLRDGFVLIRGGEAWMINVHIAHYEHGNRQNHDEMRQRKLLLHKKEIDHMYGQVTQKNWTIVPLRMYINNAGRAKVEVALVRGKHTFDKRDTIRDRDARRDIQRALKQAF